MEKLNIVYMGTPDFSVGPLEKLIEKYNVVMVVTQPDKEILSLEKEMLGIYISGHPLEKLRSQIEQQTNINTMQIRNIDEQMTTNIEENQIQQETKIKFKDGQSVKYAGIITSIKKKYTKNNKIMAFVTVEDLYGEMQNYFQRLN